MPKAYWVVTYRSIKNPDVMPAYAKLAGPAIAAAGGRFLVRGNPSKTYESGVNERVVLIEFDNHNLRLQKKMAKRVQKILKNYNVTYQVET